MKLNDAPTLSIKTIESIRNLARKERLALGFGDEVPIANALKAILEKLGITLLQYPIQNTKDTLGLSAMLFCDESFAFIGVNTADYYDKQIFAIAHELYHYYTGVGSRLCWQENNTSEEIEIKANRFAAEFLLPQETLKRRIIEEFGAYSLGHIETLTLLRFIARLYCSWHLPYRSLVQRLKEIEAISEEQYQELNNIDERNPEGIFYRIGTSIQSEVFIKLNSISNTVGTSAHAIETIVRNFEHGLIDEQTLSDTLRLFNKNPADFGYEVSISQDDLDEIGAFSRGWGGEGK